MENMEALMKPREGWIFERGKAIPDLGHLQLLVTLPNGYVVSVIRGTLTYGGTRGLFEAAVFKPGGGFARTGLTGEDDVIGHLTQEDAIEFLDKVAALPPAVRQP